MDPLTDITTCSLAEEDSKNNKINIQQDEEEEVPDIALFCQTENDDDDPFGGINFDAEEGMWRHSLDELICQCNATKDRLLNARFEQAESIFHAERGQSKTTGTNDGTSQKDNDSDTDMNDNRSSQQSRSLPTVIRLITGTLLDNSPYCSVYENMNDKHGTEHAESDNNNSEATESNTSSNTPTLQQIARQVAREENKYLDKNQYMMYEILACTFLLSLLLTLGDNEGNTAIQMC